MKHGSREKDVASNQPSWDELRDEASGWLARLDCGKATLAEFEVWRDEDPRHAAAFVQVVDGLASLDRHKYDLKLLIPKVRPTRRRALWGGLSAVAVAALGGGIFLEATAKTTETTAVGQRKSVIVPGGRLTLNTDSQVQWRASKMELEVWLKRGEVALDLPNAVGLCLLHGADRVAEIGRASVNARLRGKLLDLAVTAGDIRLLPGKARGGVPATAAATVAANHAVLLTGTSEVMRPLSQADADFLAGWQNEEMVFAGETLETAVAEYNRYLPRKIYIADPSIAGLHLGGRFTTRDPQAFLAAVHQGFGVKVNDPGSGPIVLTK